MSNETAQCALRKMDSDLELHHRTWEIDGDLYRCRHCKSGQLSSKGAEKFVHASDCVAKSTVSDHPWLDLVRHTSSLSRPTQVEHCSGSMSQLEVAGEAHAIENRSEGHYRQVGCLHNGPKEQTYV
ncbi:hypothetical protein I4I80_02650 [Pseudomonas syringae pv. tomato]|nr:hypothetical protein [Pseudomonas syringae pv. tomato]MBW8023643.1 hypothetical protein [Pseudomonas syringae pv. tomato]